MAAVIALTSFTAPAKALSFNWQFSNVDGGPDVSNGGIVKGTISGLLDNTPNQKTGLTVTVTSAPNAPLGGWLNDWTYQASSPFSSDTGFSVINGMVASGEASFRNSLGDYLVFRNDSPELSRTGSFGNSGVEGVAYTPQIPSVPGPLPILGAASALGWSRKVRNRLRSAQRSALR
jgi:hypothetical protein